jgi:hypothetical protein
MIALSIKYKIGKLYQYGICDIPHNIIKSYLRNSIKQMQITHKEGKHLKDYF